jgi:hypothetical protein
MDDLKKTGHCYEIIWGAYSEVEIYDWRDTVKGKVSQVCDKVFWDIEPETDRQKIIRHSSEPYEYPDGGDYTTNLSGFNKDFVIDHDGKGWKMHEPREEKIIWKGYARFYTGKKLSEEFIAMISFNKDAIRAFNFPWG